MKDLDRLQHFAKFIDAITGNAVPHRNQHESFNGETEELAIYERVKKEREDGQATEQSRQC